MLEQARRWLGGQRNSTPAGKPVRVMAIGTGAYGNIGDALIRSHALGWVKDADSLHVYVGRATPEWIARLRVSESMRFYGIDQRRQWLRVAFAREAPSALLFDPGAVSLGRAALSNELVSLLLTAVVRLRGGVVVRPPRGVGDQNRVVRLIHSAGCLLSEVTAWRDAASYKAIRVGRVCPDIAFEEALHLELCPRTHMVISMRGKRDLPSEAWFSAVSELADHLGLRLITASQVWEDEPRSKEIARRLGCEHLKWGASDDLAHEADLRSLYRQSRLVVSDRLHVTILALMDGAFAVELAPSPKPKIADTLQAVGVPHVVIDSRHLDRVDLIGEVESLMERHEDVRAALSRAHDAALALGQEVRAATGLPNSSEPPQV